MAAPTPSPRSPAACIDGLAEALRGLLIHLRFTLVLTELPDDIGLLNMNERVIYLDAHSCIADQAHFLRECWLFCFIDPVAASDIEPVMDRRLVVVRNDD